MADNHFDLVLVWDNLGGAVRVNGGGKATVTDPSTGAPVTVVQNGQSVTTVTADSNGRVSFIAQQGIVKLTSGGLSQNYISPEQATAGAANAAAAQDAQVAAEAARDDAQASASSAASSVSSKVDKGSLVLDARDYGAAGNGTTDDTAALQRALTAASDAFTASGKRPTVRITPGTYKVTGELTTPGNVTIDATGATIAGYWADVSGDKVLLANGTSGEAPTAYNGHGNITIIGGIWDARGHTYANLNYASPFAFAHADRVVFDRVTFRNVRRGHGIDLTACRGVKFLACRFEGYTDTGDPRLTEAIQVDVAGSSANFPRFGAYDATPCDDVLVQGCTFTSSADCGAWPRAVGSHAARTDRPHTNIRVVGNHMNAYEVAVRAYNWRDFSVTGNTIVGGGTIGVYSIDATTPGDDTKNAAGTQTNASAVVGPGSINANTVVGALGHGVHVKGYPTSGPARAVTVQGNTFRSPAATSTFYGIRIEQAELCSVVANTVKDSPAQAIGLVSGSGCVVSANTVSGGGSHGIDVNASSYCVISDNYITNAGSHGISVSGTGSDNAIRSNTINGCSAVIASSVGIRVNTSSNCSVIANVVRKGSTSPTYGLQVASGASGTYYFANDLRTSGVTASLNDVGVGSLTTAGNLT